MRERYEDAGPAAHWARALDVLPNRKFAATAATYRAAGLAADSDAQRLVTANIEFVWRYYARMVAARSRAARRRLQGTFTVTGREHLDAALAEHRGVVLVSAHLGDFDLAGSWLAEHAGPDVVAVVDAVAQSSRQAFFDEVRGSMGITLRRRGVTRLADLTGDLARGSIVLTMLDRADPSFAIDTQFLGRPGRLSLAPYALAKRTGCPVLVGTTTTENAQSRTISFGAPRFAGPSERDARGFTAGLARELAERIAQRPSQWHVPADMTQLPFVMPEPASEPGAGIAAPGSRRDRLAA